MAREPLTRKQHSYAKRTLEALEKGAKALEQIANHHQEADETKEASNVLDVRNDIEEPPGYDAEQETVTVTLKDCTLPTDEDKRKVALEALRREVGGVLSVGVKYDPNTVATHVGHHYTEIDDDCPWCGSALELRDFSYTNNGAIAEANCEHEPDCGFRGQVVYRLTDIVEQGLSEKGEVEKGELTPSYHPY